MLFAGGLAMLVGHQPEADADRAARRDRAGGGAGGAARPPRAQAVARQPGPHRRHQRHRRRGR
ncbi:MAG: hypothetical protein MZW92_38750 [Comamonadaceae bacterium]|nr:hypothetical protein [Comamonadaceae bacterium]